ncbi:MAG: hypothetical protein ACD_2C00079G0017 [uncultured bacterium (gcode 4)]|uniref:Cell division protein FtsL n=1 Tax=uncultured bacterium (gcode 4) TaxID=1234023 RepID=K2H228_9BACT|nr:MAG: hypothetical protein ACD_2C00079G0017 [uncultured bacterium (gcode 4)]
MNPNLIVMKKWRIPFFSERKTTRENYKLSFTKTYVMALLMIWFLWIYYVWTLNVNATKWYVIRNLEIEKRNLTFEENLVDMKIAEAQSLDNVVNDPAILVMQTAENPQYLVLKDVNLAFLKWNQEQ